MSDDWPTLGEELARKSLAYLESRVKLYERGKITKRELWLIADALADSTQGLIPSEHWDVIYGVRQSLKGS